MPICDKIPPLKWVVNNILTVIRDLGVWGAGVAPVVAVVTGSVLQTEAGLVALSHWMVSLGIQQLVVAELVHAVEVPVDQQQRSATLNIKCNLLKRPEGQIRSVVNRLRLHYLKDRICSVRLSEISHLLTFRLLAKKNLYSLQEQFAGSLPHVLLIWI